MPTQAPFHSTYPKWSTWNRYVCSLSWPPKTQGEKKSQLRLPTLAMTTNFRHSTWVLKHSKPSPNLKKIHYSVKDELQYVFEICGFFRFISQPFIFISVHSSPLHTIFPLLPLYVHLCLFTPFWSSWVVSLKTSLYLCIRYINHLIYLISQCSQRSHTPPGMPCLLTSWKTAACQAFLSYPLKRNLRRTFGNKPWKGFFFFFHSESKT